MSVSVLDFGGFMGVGNKAAESTVIEITSQFYSEEYVASFFGYTLKSLRTHRSKNGPERHPPSQKFGRTVKYPKKLFHDWVNRQPINNDDAACAR